jgi:hypothetical protein
MSPRLRNISLTAEDMTGTGNRSRSLNSPETFLVSWSRAAELPAQRPSPAPKG